MKSFIKLFESELARAEVTLAVKDISDSLQKMASDLSSQVVDDLPAVTEKIKVTYGLEEGNNFEAAVSEIMNALVKEIMAAKSKIDDHSLIMSGDAEAGEMFAEPEMDEPEMDDEPVEFSDDDRASPGIRRLKK